jgi:hypothetical protein
MKEVVEDLSQYLLRLKERQPNENTLTLSFDAHTCNQIFSSQEQSFSVAFLG